MQLLSRIVAVLALMIPAGARVLEETGTFGVAGFQHAGSLSEIVCLSDGKRVLSSSRDQCVRLWEIETGKLIRTYTKTGIGDMWGIRLLPGEQEFLAAGGSGEIVRYNLGNGEVIRTYKHSSTAYRLALHPDGKRFIGTDSKNNAILWDLETGEEIRSFSEHTGDVYTAIILDEGKTLITGSDDGTFKSWDLEKGHLLETYQGEKKKKFGDIFTIANSPDGTRFAMVSGDDNVRVYDVKTMEELWKIRMEGTGQVVAWSPDGKLLATGCDDRNLYLFDSENGKVLRKIPVARYGHTPITFTTDGTRIISGGDSILHIHDVKSGERITPTMGLPVKAGGFDHVVVGNGGKLVVTSGESEVHVWNLDDPSVNQKFEEPSEVTKMALSRDGTLLAVGDDNGNVSIRDTTKFNKLVSVDIEDTVNGLAFSADGKGLLVTGDNSRVSFWNVGTGKKIWSVSESNSDLMSLVLSEDGSIFVTTGNDRTVRIWSMATRNQESFFQLREDHPYSLAYLNGGRSLIVSTHQQKVLGRLLPMIVEDVVIDEAEVKSLAGKLADSDFNVRQDAMMTLAKMGMDVIEVFDQLDLDDPEVRSRLEGVKDVIRGANSREGLDEIHEFEESFQNLASDPMGRFWVGSLGLGGAAKLTIGEIVDEKFSVLESLETEHGTGEIAFSADGSHLATVNNDGTFSVFSVTRD